MKYYIKDIDEALSEHDIMEQLQYVSEQRKEKILRYRNHSSRQQSLMAYQLLQKALLEEYNISTPPIFEEIENGKPIIKNHEHIHFNISHCQNAVACAISDSPIGIDIEKVPDNLNESLINYIFNDYEKYIINKHKLQDNVYGIDITPNMMFTKLWTMKESTVKLSGRGLEGKDQIRSLLVQYHNGASPLNYITRYDPKGKWVMTICQEIKSTEDKPFTSNY